MALLESFREKASLRGIAIAIWIVVASGVLVAKYGSFWSREGVSIAEATESASRGPGSSSVPSTSAGRPDDTDKTQNRLDTGPQAPLAITNRSTGEPAKESNAPSEAIRTEATESAATSAGGLLGVDADGGPDRESGGEAIDYFRRLLEENPSHPGALFEVGRHLESEGRFVEAIAMYERLLRVQGDSASEVLLRLGRTHYWADRPAAASIWYERYQNRAALSDSMAAIVEFEQARALFEADRPDEALRLITSGARETCGSVERTVLAARAATASGNMDSAIRFLECLRGSEALSGERRMWLAGLHRASGAPDLALTEYEAALSDLQSDSAREEALRAIGDLRLDRGDSSRALEAYSALSAEPDRSLLLARAHAAAGEVESALPLLKGYVEVRPGDVDARLSLARLYASLQRPEPAIEQYLTVLEVDSTLVPEVELARIHMAAGDFQAAAEWAERAMKSEADYWEAGLTLAAAYRFIGRRHEAERLFGMLESRPLSDPEIHRWQGRVSLARGANLDAWIELSRFADAVEVDDGEVRLLQAQASLGRQDAGRARTALEQVPPPEDDPARVERMVSRVDSLTRSEASLPVDYTTDFNGLSRRTEALDAVLWPWSAVRVRGGLEHVDLEQGSARRSALTFGLSADRYFPVPSLEVGGSVGLDKIELGPLSYSGDLWGRWSFTDGSEVGLSLSRDLLWNSGPARNRQEPTRIVDLAGVGTSPYVEGLRVNARKAFGEHEHLLAEGGRVLYPDGNHQDFVYGQLQIPLESGVGSWTVLTPRVYLESFDRTTSEYFSPRSYVSAGVGGHTIRDLGSWKLETELVPQVFWRPDDTGLALRGLVKTSFSLGSLRPEVGGYAYLQNDEYYVYQAFARLSMPLGGSDR